MHRLFDVGGALDSQTTDSQYFNGLDISSPELRVDTPLPLEDSHIDNRMASESPTMTEAELHVSESEGLNKDWVETGTVHQGA